MRPFRAGVFAAGLGSRMRPDGSVGAPPKALTPIADRPLVEWILRDIVAAGASEIVVIVNEQSQSVRDHITQTMPSCPVTWIVETTPSSMHSFLRVLETLALGGDTGPFLMSTVDTIAPPGTFASFVDAAEHARPADMILALTSRVDDDNPLTMRIGPVQSDSCADIVAVGEGAYATAGYYFVR